MNTPPAAAYQILDIRAPISTEALKLPAHQEYPGPSNDEDIRKKPPTPPASTDHSLDAFNGDDLVDTILESLDKPAGSKSIPTFVLYDTRGLQLFDEITHLDDYYLTNAEMGILKERADQLAARLHDGSVIIELGAGSLRKTSLILEAIERQKLKVTYYALDLDQHELERSLGSLGDFTYVRLMGLLGTYDQGIPWLSQQFASADPPIHKMILWLGSSIGNQNRRESAMFLHRLQQMCLQPGDFLLVGLDKRKDPAKIKTAYDDSLGTTREFIMNGLDHINVILSQTLFDRSKFDYDSRYQSDLGRHVAHYRARENIVLTYQRRAGDQLRIPVEKDELIHVEYSYKYSDEEITHMLSAAQLDKAEDWSNKETPYVLVLAECRAFKFDCDRSGARETLYPTRTAKRTEQDANCVSCMADYTTEYFHADKEGSSASLAHIVGSAHWPEYVPSLHEWQQLWRSWDTVTNTMMDQQTMLFERPIALRHPFIFYLGHIPVFLDMLLTRSNVDGASYTEPTNFLKIFERGIDPDMEDPTRCNPHSKVPTRDEDWPSSQSILLYQQKVRNRLQSLLLEWEAEDYSASKRQQRRRAARVVWMCFEHEAMHLETLLYMLIQSPNILPPASVATVPWKMAAKSELYASARKSQPRCLDAAPLISVPEADVTIGHDDDEDADFNASDEPVEFGWDNEHPKRQAHVDAFSIQSRPVTNGEYLAFLKEISSDDWPVSWVRMDDGGIGVRTSFGTCSFDDSINWPVQVNYYQGSKYAEHRRMRLPTEAEMLRFRECMSNSSNKKIPNIGFQQWHPTDVSNDQVHTLGDVWEWTATTLDRYPGFKPSKLYPGFSADFFDGKHHVVLGGSWATHPRIAERWSVRNWYQAGYPYVFAGFRCCSNV
ncbi:hypothetical protein BDB00DRAFT_875060 [Zychaea mexicana]|uniref:uncharacterized protein n=1 Tax=Zychaea mexicana TaxID=64656 RepID=UPI0022FE139F|nr:uncharacterized protein BDB00DRAFT_875060 [Zychaea mexicana]KAI9490730.1 hypothetical protein BDB00DRAFT_875060 [Zychaea mexicana]